MNAPRKIELTVKHRVASLTEQADRLYAAFKELRRSKVWKRYVRGGVAVLEVTINPKDRLWHPHLHIVFDGEFFPQKLLSDEWLRITTDSNYAFIKPVHDRERTAKYVGDYLSKPCSFDELTAPEIREYAEAMHGRRLVVTFGKCHATNPDPKPESHVPAGSDPLISLHRVVEESEHGHERARKAVDLLRAMSPVWASALGFLPYSTAEQPDAITAADMRFIADVCIEIRDAGAAVAASLRSDDDCGTDGPPDADQMHFEDFSHPPPTTTRYL